MADDLTVKIIMKKIPALTMWPADLLKKAQSGEEEEREDLCQFSGFIVF